MARFGSRMRRGATRRRRLIAYAVACALAGAVTAALILPQYFSNATSTAASTTYKTAVNETDGSAAASSDAPGGAKAGTAKPGDTLKWAVSYQNNTSANASVSLTDVLTTAGTYVPGSLQLPPKQNPMGTVTPQYSTNGGATWATGAPPADASGVGFTGTLMPQGTRQLSLPFTTPPAIALAMTGGDPYNAVVYKGQVYAVNHHRSGKVVYCARMDGTTCAGWPTNGNLQYWSATPGAPIGTGLTFAGSTAQPNGTWVARDKLYWYAGPSDSSSAGLGCLDLTTPTPTSCGYLPRTGKVVSNTAFAAQVGGSGIPASDGNFYSATTNNGSAAIMCVTPTGAACTGVPSLLAGVTSPYGYTAATFGDYVFASVQQTTTSSWQTYCYNVKTGLCTSSWPRPGATSAAFQGNNFAPILSTSGSLAGICTITNGPGSSSACWNLQGQSVANPYSGTGAAFYAGGSTAGDALVLGSKVYLPNGDQVMCRDFGAYPGSGTVPPCAGFTNVPNAKNYTVRPTEGLEVDCLVTTGDSGQIRFFNALSGGSCTNSAPQAVDVAPTAYYCGSGAGAFRGWSALSLVGAATTAYSGALVTLRDQDGTIVPNFDTVRLAAGATMSLTSVPPSVTSLSATVVLSGVKDPTGVKAAQMSVSWLGDPPQLCFRTTAPPLACDAPSARTLSNTATAVTTSASGSDGPGGNSTGVVQFTERAEASQCSLAIRKTSSVQTGRPGDRVSYAITVHNTGTQAYDAARFADDLTDVLTEAAFGGDQSATTGTVTYAKPFLSWSGALAPGATATITYSVTVRSPDPGDHRLVNTVVSPSPHNNCVPGSVDPRCTTTTIIEVTDLLWHKVDATEAKNILSGAEWVLTPVDAAGAPTGPATVVTDCVAEAISACTGADTEPVGGVFRVTNLGPGEYRLVETRAPVGFLRNPTPIPVTIGRTTVTIPLADIVNEQMPVPAIPLTGGVGTDLLTFSGGGLMTAVLGLAGWHLFRRLRRVG